MKTKIIGILTLLCMVVFSCENESGVVDPIYEFVSFTGDASVNLNEFDHSEQGYPLTAKLLAFKPYQEDIDLTLEVTATNAQDNVDFIIAPHDAIKIRAGSLVSDTIWVKTVDNASSTVVERTFQVKIKSISKSDVKIGLGITAPEKAAINFKILDDECSLTTAIYNATLNNDIGGYTTKPATGVVSGNTVTLTGDLMDYSPFSSASLTLTLTPASAGATKGKATFGQQDTGTDTDGYAYRFIEVGEGSYDVCSGTISIEYDIYYEDGGWWYWYSTTNVFSVP